jgi:hypothetical protein
MRFDAVPLSPLLLSYPLIWCWAEDKKSGTADFYFLFRVAVRAENGTLAHFLFKCLHALPAAHEIGYVELFFFGVSVVEMERSRVVLSTIRAPQSRFNLLVDLVHPCLPFIIVGQQLCFVFLVPPLVVLR